MILFVRLEKIGARLGEVNPLIDRYQRREMSFPDLSIEWLAQVEKELASLRLGPDAAELATLRGRIVKADDAPAGPDGPPSRKAIRQSRNAAAHEALERAAAILRERMAEAEARLRQFEDKLTEGITAATLSGAIPGQAAACSRSEWLADVWGALHQFQPTRGLSLFIAASLSGADRLFIIDRVMSRLTDPELPIAALSSRASDA